MPVTIGKQVIPTPEHDKVDALEGANNTVGAFLEWLNSRYTLCVWGEEFDEETGDYDGGTLYPAYPKTEDLIAEFYDINLDAYYKEKDAILNAVRLQYAAARETNNVD